MHQSIWISDGNPLQSDIETRISSAGLVTIELHGKCKGGEDSSISTVVEIEEYAEWIRWECYRLHMEDLKVDKPDMANLAERSWSRLIQILSLIDQSRSQFLRRFRS